VRKDPALLSTWKIQQRMPIAAASHSLYGRCYSSYANSTPKRFSSTTTSSHHDRTSLNKVGHLPNVSGSHGSYHDEYARSIRDPHGFWGEKARELHWFQTPTTILQHDPRVDPHYWRWYPDGLFNTCYNCLDVHVQNEKRKSQVALYYDSPVTSTKLQYTYEELLEEVAVFAQSLLNVGVQVGDRVVIYMPMIPQAAVAMLACARIGAVHSVVFGGFAPKELASRILHCQPKIVVSASAGVEPTRIVPYKPLLDQAMDMVRQANPECGVKHAIIVQRRNVQECSLNEPFDLDYDALLAQTTSQAEAVPLPSNHPHYILYTSGTTGHPKGVVRDTAGMAVALKYSMGAFYDAHPGDSYFAASDIGWAVGHGYGVYGPLLQGCSTVLYEGKPVGTPDAGALWRLIEEYRIKALFVAPTALRAIKQADPNAELAQKYDLSSFRALFLAGEHSDPSTLQYCQAALQQCGAAVRDPIDHWWQTELGHPGIGNALGLGRMPLRPGSCTGPAPGFDVDILSDSGEPVPPGELGNLILKTPLPPGTLLTLYNNDQGFVDTYLKRFPGYYDTEDAASRDEAGYIRLLGRRDQNFNTAGHLLSTGALEEVLQEHPMVAECAVITVRDDVKGVVPVGLVITNRDCTMDEDQLNTELVQRVRESVGPIANFKKVAVVKALPKTRSGKVLRGTMSKIANGEPYRITPTIEDPEVFTYLQPIIERLVKE
jgi:propionyl-CoA synthetase